MLFSTCLKVEKVPHIDYLELQRKQGKISEIYMNANFLFQFDGMQQTIVHDAINIFLCEQGLFVMTMYLYMENGGGSRFTHYTTYVGRNYKSNLFTK